MDNKKRVSAVKAAVVQRGPGAPFKPKTEKAKKGKGSYTRKKKNFRDFREEVVTEAESILSKIGTPSGPGKKYIRDPLYANILKAENPESLLKAMKALESIRGKAAVKELQAYVRRQMSEEFVSEEKCNCDCGEDPCVTCGKSHHMQESLEISENKEQWGKVFDNLKKGDKISVQWESVMSSSPKEPVTFVAVRKSHSKKYGVTTWTIAREGEPSGRVKKFLYQRGGAGNAPTMAIGDMGVALTHLSKAVNESTEDLTPLQKRLADHKKRYGDSRSLYDRKGRKIQWRKREIPTNPRYKEIPKAGWTTKESVHERSLTDDEKGEKERYVKGMKKKFSGFRDRYGEDAKSVMYGTATNMAKEEVDLLEAMEPEQYNADAQKAAEYFNSEMEKIFPSSQYTHNAKYKGPHGDGPVSVHALGGSLKFVFAVLPRKEAGSSNVAMLNAFGKSIYMMHLTNNSGKQVSMDKFPIELLTMDYKAKGKGIKYRKINGKSPMDSTKKLVAWFKKNKEAFASGAEG